MVAFQPSHAFYVVTVCIFVGVDDFSRSDVKQSDDHILTSGVQILVIVVQAVDPFLVVVECS